jgi:hypothetical protein
MTVALSGEPREDQSSARVENARNSRQVLLRKAYKLVLHPARLQPRALQYRP